MLDFDLREASGLLENAGLRVGLIGSELPASGSIQSFGHRINWNHHVLIL